ncbi:MAG: hypothetical protein IK115_05760 [Lachnospiraceae bacterium]|nr:hypothetical protein [Lachnospiraceae bacterium]
MSYTNLPVFEQGCILIVVTLTLFAYFFCLEWTFSLGRSIIHILSAVFMTVLCFGLFQFLIMIQQGDYVPDYPVPMVVILPLMLVLLLYVLLLQYRIRRWRKEHLSAVSVKEAFDRLPAGLLFYTPSGLPVMVNETMREAGHSLFAEMPTDACLFWEKLRGIDLSGGEDGDSVIVAFPDERIFNIRRRELKMKGSTVYELTALDVSREYELTKELQRRRDKAGVLNSRLKALMNTIEYVSMNRELLQLKTALHDNIGQSILIAKRYLYAPGSVDKKRMLDFWRDNIRHLTKDEPEEWELPYYVISKEADRLGVSLNILGDLPEEAKLIPVVDAAISVHIGNTLKHADGTEATIIVKKAGKDYILCFTNNGRQPEGEIREQGGLLNLRREVESIGGRMELAWQPAFEMKLVLPGEEQ